MQECKGYDILADQGPLNRQYLSHEDIEKWMYVAQSHPNRLVNQYIPRTLLLDERIATHSRIGLDNGKLAC